MSRALLVHDPAVELEPDVTDDDDVPRSRASSAASATGSLDDVAAQTSTASAPRPRLVDDDWTCSADAASAKSPRDLRGSVPITRPPDARSRRPASWPIRPSPTTRTTVPGPAP